jgi:ribonuclease HI
VPVVGTSRSLPSMAAETNPTDRTVVYTDGACRGNPGPGGWAWIVPDGPWANGADPHTTNQRMELTAVLEALLAIDGPVGVMSDSTYVVNCFRDRWWEGWLRRDWRNSKKEPVANRDLWEPLIDIYQPRAAEITFTWVKAHAGDEWNDIADRLAVEAAARQLGRSGVGIPDDLGPPDGLALPPAPAGGPANSTWRPTGRSLVVLGVQPPQLGGYEENRISADVRRRLRQIIEAKRALHPDLTVLTGLRLGAETLGAEAARLAGVPYAAVLPYPDPDSRWPDATRARFADLVASAAVTVQLEKKVPESPQRAGQAIDRRNGWLRKVADEALIVWDGVDRRVGKVVKDFEQELEDDVWVVDVSAG